MRRGIGGIMNALTGDYESTVHSGQALITAFRIPRWYRGYGHPQSLPSLQTPVFDVVFPSPITVAAFESHLDSIAFWVGLGCGGCCLKTIKPQPAKGNPRPRLQQVWIQGVPHLLNALGLPGPGVAGLIESLKAHPLRHMGVPMGLSIGGDTVADYHQVVDAIGDQSFLDSFYLELNISCPNTATGCSLHDQVSDIEAIVRYIRRKRDRLIVIKVSPDASDDRLRDIASLATQFDKVTLNAGNTQRRAVADLLSNGQAFQLSHAGLSGPALFERTLAMAKCLQPFQLPLIATGGITTADHIRALRDTGVAIVGVATQLVTNPFSVVRWNHELAGSPKR